MKTGLFFLCLPVILAAGSSASSITLMTSGSPSIYGHTVTLTANVSSSSATGFVTFYDGTTVLGTSILGSGQASLTTSLLASGARSLRAYYAGDNAYAPSISEVFTQTVNAVAAVAFGLPATYGIGTYANGASYAATGDFNGDGVADLAVGARSKVSVLMGNGDGTFQPAATYQAGDSPIAVAVGDFNRDGKSDLAVADSQDGTVSIFLGNGNGTFQTAGVYTAAGPYSNTWSILAADFNNDGKPDLLVGSLVGLDLLLGNGDGTFQPPVSLGFSGGPSFAVADFNGDGNADLVIAGSSLMVLLGNGDGTFRTPVQYGSPAGSPLVGDFNGDGKVDIAFATSSDDVTYYLSVLPGKGDGTFGKAVASGTISGTISNPVVGDVNGDGKLDLVFADSSGPDVSVFLGNGDGTFQSPVTFGTGIGVTAPVVGQFNGDGRTDLAVTSFNGTGISILLGVATAPDLTISMTHTGTLRQSETGVPYMITVSNAGNAATSGTVSVVANLTATAMAGTGWTCTLGTVTCTRSDPLPVSGGYPAIMVTATIPSDAPAVLTSTATVSGGGDNTTSNHTASDTASVYLTPVLVRLVNAADASQQPLAPGSIASLYGSNLSYTTAQAPLAPWPTTLGNVTLSVNGMAAPLGLVSPGQINFQIPYETANDTLEPSITVTNEGGQSFPAGLFVAAAAPGIFAGMIQNANSTTNSISQPAVAGSTITVFFTGAGAVMPAVADGSGAPSSPLSVPVQPVFETLGNSSQIAVAASLAPGMVGIAQAGISIPANLAPGSYPLSLMVNSSPSAPATVYVGGPAPVITSIAPNNAPAGVSSFTTEIDGLNLGGGAVVSLQAPGGQVTSITPYIDSGGQLIVGIPYAPLVTAGTAQISITSGLGVVSNSMPFYVTPFTISTVTPHRGTAGSGATAVTIAGQNLSTATALVFTPPGGTATSIGLSQIESATATATIPAGLLTSPGQALLALGNGSGALSNAESFTIKPALPSTGVLLTSSANPSVYGQPVTLKATVSPSTATGKVTFYDGTTVLGTSTLASGQATLTTILLAADARSLTAYYSGDAHDGPSTSPVLTQTVNALPDNGFLAPVYYPTGGGSYSIAAGDFNGDGKVDLVTVGSSPNQVSVLLGKGDGTFQPAADFSVGGIPDSVVVGDFNLDSKTDLAVATNSGVEVLMGNGDGTFQPFVDYAAYYPQFIAVGDFNGDGIPDLVVNQPSLGGVYVSLGNGDGTFASGVFSATGGAAFIADFNGDGIPDLAVPDSSGIGVQLGRGDGTFQPPLNYTGFPGGGFPPSIAVADFNGDGKLDLVGLNPRSVSIALGKGDGTFGPAVTSADGSFSPISSVGFSTTGDFNGDGKVDLFVVAGGNETIQCIPYCYGGMYVFPGNGDGTFQPPTSYAILGGARTGAFADFNGDGRPDFATGGAEIFLGTGGKSTQTIAFVQPSNFTEPYAGFSLFANASSNLPVSFSSTTESVCTVSGQFVAFVAAGTCTITASQPGNATYAAATPVTYSFTVIPQAAQTIDFGPLSNQILGLPVPPLSATASSGFEVTFASNTGAVCSVSGVNITLIAPGTCSITAYQTGDVNYTAATPVTQTFTVFAAAAAFLDQNGAPTLTFNGSTNFPDAGGFLIGAPGVTQDSNGNVYVVGLDGAGGVHLNSYSYASSTWNGWQYSGGILDTSSGLTAAVDPSGVVWFTGRDIGNRFWINSWNGASFGGWILVANGIFAADSVPQIAIPSDGSIYVIGKDVGGRIWSNSYNPMNKSFTGWVDRQAVMIGQPTATSGQDGKVYVAVRSVTSNSPVYITQIPAQNAATANTWLNGGGAIDTDPQITSQGGTVYLLAEAGGDTVYLLTFAESTQMFGTWSFTNGTLMDSTIAAAGGNVFVAGRDSADRIYWYSLTGNSWFFAGGAGVSSTALAGGK